MSFDNPFGGTFSAEQIAMLMDHNFDPGCLRPYMGDDRRSYVTVNQGGQDRSLVTNSTALLPYEVWKQIDTAVLGAARPRLRAFGDLRAAGLTYNVPNALGVLALQYQTMSGGLPAHVSMDGLVRGQNDQPEFDLRTMPLPVVSKDFQIPTRLLAASRRGEQPLDTSIAAEAAVQVATTVEKLTLGANGDFQFAGGSLYGYYNFPQRITGTLTAPTAQGWTPATLLSDVLLMREASKAAYHYGPWALYNCSAWDAYLDNDYNSTSGKTLRQRLSEIEGITAVRTADHLTNTKFPLIMVQQSADVAQAVVGLDPITLQWQVNPMVISFKVMAILACRLRSDFNGKTGIVHYQSA